MKRIKKCIIFIQIIFFIIVCYSYSCIAKTIKTEADRVDTLVLLKIIEDGGNLNTNVTRAEFAKIIIRASDEREKVSDTLSEQVCNDVGNDAPYAAYIKRAIDKGYMFTYLGGLFKPYEYVTYDDLSRACLSLLSYTNEDFRGNQVVGRNLKFKGLGLDENIEKSSAELLTKIDIINGIYNTLKEYIKDTNTVYGTKIFDKLIIDSDKELNASEYKENSVEGPFIAKSIDDIKVSFDITKQNIYINLVKGSYDELKDDINTYGYAVYYIDVDNNSIVAYTERQDVSSPVVLRKGYVYKVYYTASNMVVPYRVDIDRYKYMLDSEEVKFAFSANGSVREEDYIIYLCNKMNDIDSVYLDESGKVVHQNDESEPYDGSIILVFDIDSTKR